MIEIDRDELKILEIGPLKDSVLIVKWSHKLLKAPKERALFLSQTMYVGYEMKYLTNYKESLEVQTEPGGWIDLEDWWNGAPEEIKTDIIKMMLVKQIEGESRYYTRSRILS